jgi:hypothetical protein
MAVYDPLFRPGDEPSAPASLEVEVRVTRELLDRLAGANIHDEQAMLKAATGLYYRTLALLAALDAEQADRP